MASRTWAQQCQPEELWKRALLLLRGETPGSGGVADGAKRALFGEELGSDEEAAAVVLAAAQRCCERNCPFAIWAAAKASPNRRLSSLVLAASAPTIALLPVAWQSQFVAEPIAPPADAASDAPHEEFLTPTKKILLTGATGGEAAVRQNGSRVSNNRERLRDVLSVLFLEPHSARLKCNDLLQLLDAENEAWFCDCFADVYSRYCNKVADQERCMIEKRASVAAEETELALVRMCCETLFEKHLALWQQMCLTLAHKIEVLRGETDQLLCLVALETAHLARLLSVVSFLGTRSGTAHLGQLGLAHGLFELARDADAEGDSRQLVLLLVALDQFLDVAPAGLSLARVGRAAVPLVQRLRAAASRLSSFADLFVFATCNNVLAALRAGPGDAGAGGVSVMDDFASLSQQLRHPVVIRNLLLHRAVSERAAAPVSPPPLPLLAPSPGAPFSSNQETKYWFFRMQNALLKLVNVVAHSVAQNAVQAAMAEAAQLLREGDRFEAEEEACFDLAFVRCQLFVKKDCAELLPRLAPRGTDAPVLKRAVDYACEAALQQCYDSLGDSVKEHFKSVRPRHAVSAPAALAPPHEKRFVSTVLQSPFVRRPTVRRQTRGDFAEMAKLTVPVPGLEEPCDDWTEFFCFLILVANFDQWEQLSGLTSEQRVVLDACLKECNV